MDKPDILSKILSVRIVSNIRLIRIEGRHDLKQISEPEAVMEMLEEIDQSREEIRTMAQPYIKNQLSLKEGV